MRREVLLAFGAIAFVILLIGAAVWVANAPIQPATQQAHLVLSDERIPH